MNKSGLVAAVVVATVSLSACVVAPVPASGGYYGEPVVVAPPPPRVEYVGAPPVAGYIWIGGYWNWYGGRHVWVPGRWAPPRHGYVWVPHRWQQDGRNWRQEGGYWREERGSGRGWRR